MWQEIKEFLSEPYISTFVGLFVGLVGIILAIIFYIKSKIFSKISSYHEFTNLIGRDHSKLPQQISIAYAGELVDKVSSSEFIIWNSGNKVITKETLPTKNRLRIQFKSSVKVLRYQVSMASSDANNIAFKLGNDSPNCIFIDFDFLEANEGARIEILHTGDKADIGIEGKLIGVESKFNNASKAILKRKVNKKRYGNKAINKLISIYLKAIPLLCIVYLCFSFIIPEVIHTQYSELKTGDTRWAMRLMVSTLLFLSLFVFFDKRMPSYPTKLRKSDS